MLSELGILFSHRFQLFLSLGVLALDGTHRLVVIEPQVVVLNDLDLMAILEVVRQYHFHRPLNYRVDQTLLRLVRQQAIIFV